MIKAFYYLALLTSLLFVPAGQTANSKILSTDWQVTAKPSVTQKKFTKEDVARFANSVNGDDYIEIDQKQVGDFRWVDVDHDGVYELLVTIAPGRFFNEIWIYKSIAGSKKLIQAIDVTNVEHFDGVIKDLDDDGTQEMILPTALTDYRGARSQAIWPVVYKWNGTEFQDDSKKFADFYKQNLLPEVEENIQKMEQARKAVLRGLTSEETKLYNGLPAGVFNDDDEYQETIAAEWMIRDKIARITGENERAGFERAVEWVKSSNPNMRKNAAIVFGELNDKQSLEYLENLSHDPNKEVVRRVQIIKMK